jgi:hypothetical protein
MRPADPLKLVTTALHLQWGVCLLAVLTAFYAFAFGGWAERAIGQLLVVAFFVVVAVVCEAAVAGFKSGGSAGTVFGMLVVAANLGLALLLTLILWSGAATDASNEWRVDDEFWTAAVTSAFWLAVTARAAYGAVFLLPRERLRG